jgi:hypothetical protein
MDGDFNWDGTSRESGLWLNRQGPPQQRSFGAPFLVGIFELVLYPQINRHMFL